MVPSGDSTAGSVLQVSSGFRSLVNGVLDRYGNASPADGIGNAADLMTAAERRTGLVDWGDPSFRGGLEALLDDAGRLPGLTPLGVLTFRGLIGQLLANRLRFVSSDGRRAQLAPPIIITGLPRSGTTLLHRLVGLDPAHHAPPLWELLDPFAATPGGIRRFRATLQIAFKNRLLPELDRKHFTRAGIPEECTLLLGNSFATPLFSDMAPMEGYLEWYQSSCQREVYLEYRAQLELLQERHPGRRLVLKAPAHLGNLADLVRAVPEAHLVQTHRDPTRCFFSHCSLRDTLARLVTDRPDRRAIPRLAERTFERDLRTNLAFHETHDRRVEHVAFTRLCANPIEIVRRLYDAFGLDWSAEAQRRISDYQRRFPKGRFGNHRYRDSDWGVSSARVDSWFGEYRQRFADELA
jgi:hypothetical protein